MPTKFIVAGIDGTGSAEWRRKDGANSHVYRFLTDVAAGGGGDIEAGVTSAEGAKKYWHGPGTFGTDLDDILDKALKFVLAQMDRLIVQGSCAQSDIKICLVGHSRGCVGAIKVANILNGGESLGSTLKIKTPVRVEYIGLYDTVNKSSVDIDVAMPNVADGRHARRKNRAFNGGSRNLFGTVEIPRFTPYDCDTAHGGIGGDPGYFTPLGQMTADYYCNAMQLILTQDELNRRYGHLGPLPRYRQLTGADAAERRRFLDRSIDAVIAADNHIRQGATGNGFSFGKSTALKQYGDNDSKLWGDLTKALGP